MEWNFYSIYCESHERYISRIYEQSTIFKFKILVRSKLRRTDNFQLKSTANENGNANLAFIHTLF